MSKPSKRPGAHRTDRAAKPKSLPNSLGDAAPAKTPHEDAGGRGAELAKRALIDAHPDLASEIELLSPDEAAVFVDIVQKALKKRRILLSGYILALLAMFGGMLYALYRYGSREPGEFIGWVFLIPFMLVGAILVLFGRWARTQ